MKGFQLSHLSIKQCYEMTVFTVHGYELLADTIFVVSGQKINFVLLFSFLDNLYCIKQYYMAMQKLQKFWQIQKLLVD